MLKPSEKRQLAERLEEVKNSISLLESANPDHPALYHLRSERKWMEQRLKKTLSYEVAWKLRSMRGAFMMATVGARLWFRSRVLMNPTNRLLFFIFILLMVTAIVLYQGRRLWGWDLFPNSDNPWDEYILGI